jgi:hypothetical protein
MEQHTPPHELFDLLEFCGIRQRDIVAQLGVSKTLVSLWRSGGRHITPEHYSALVAYAVDVFYETLETFVRRIIRHPSAARSKEALAVFQTFVEKLQAAQAGRDPQPLYERLTFAIVMLHTLFTHKGEPLTWDAETLEYVEVEAQNIADTARLLRAHVTAAQAAAAFQARTATTLTMLAAQMKEWSHAEEE